MQYSALYLSRLTGVPEILAEVAARPARNAELRLILVAALRTFPFKIVVYLNLAVKAAYVTEIGLCIELTVLNMVIDILYEHFKSGQVVLHIRDFYI